MTSNATRNAGELLSAYAAGQRDFAAWSISGGVLLKESLEGCTFDGAQFRDCAGAFSSFENCSFAGAEFGHCIFTGVDFLSSSLDGCSFARCVLDRCDYFMSTLRGSRFAESSVRNSCFVRANLSDCQFEATHLAGSMFGRTTLSANLLLTPSVEDAVVALPHVITPAELKRMHLMSYTVAMMADAAAAGADMPGAPGDARAQPEVMRGICAAIPGIVDFLERGGLSSDQLLPLKNVVDLTFPRPPGSVFVSYATEDQAFAEQLARVLARSSVDVWFAARSLRGGQRLYDQLMREIDSRDRMVLVVSKASMSSNWVQTELRRAARSAHMPSTRRRIIPVLLVEEDEWRSWTLLDTDSGRDLALELRSGPTYVFTGRAAAEDVASTVGALIDELIHNPPPPAGAATAGVP